jgi:hypothetical protein
MQDFFNSQRFEPPSPVKVTSLCPGLDRLASGLLLQTRALSDSLSLRLRTLGPLTSLATVTRRIILQQARSGTFPFLRKGIVLLLLVNARFQVLFTPRQGSFSPFPRGTGTLSVAREYLALESGLPRFTPNFTCSVLLRNSSGVASFSLTGLSPSLVGLSRAVQLMKRFLTPRL